MEGWIEGIGAKGDLFDLHLSRGKLMLQENKILYLKISLNKNFIKGEK